MIKSKYYSNSYLDISLIPIITLYLPFSEQEIPIYRKSKNRIGNISASQGKKFRPEEAAQLFYEKEGLNVIKGGGDWRLFE